MGGRQTTNGFETRSAPASLAAARRGFAFYVADPISSIHHRKHRRHKVFRTKWTECFRIYFVNSV